MISTAYKLTVEQTEYIGHAWVNEDATDDYGKPKPNGKFIVGDVIVISSGRVIVTEVFEGFDFHTLKPVSYFKTQNLCWNCRQPYSSTDEYKAKHEGYYGMHCKKAF